MDPAAIAEFNALKAADLLQTYPITIEFTQNKGKPFGCSFGETRDDGSLNPVGQAIQHHRVGALFWPRSIGFAPDLLHTFKVLAFPADPSLVGSTWKILESARAGHEAVVKFTCLKQE
jgi:hypothetical protein